MDEDRLDEKRYVLACLDEIDAVFFLPLQEPLGLREKEVLPSYGFIDAEEAQTITESGLAFVKFPLGSSGGHIETTEIDVQQINKWFHYCTFLSSLMVHSVQTDMLARMGFDAANLVAHANYYSAITGEMPPLSTLETARFGSRDDEAAPRPPRESGIGIVTVLEAVVPLRMVGGVPRFTKDWLDISEAIRPNAAWPYIAATQKDLAPRLSLALDHAITDIRDYQRAYHAATGDPITLLTRERLPSFVPVILRRKGLTSDTPSDWEYGVVQVNQNLRSLIRPSTLTEEQLKDLFRARPRVSQSAPFAAFMDLRREAEAALARQGDVRLAAILCGGAAESLLDELLLHLLWEEGARPEDVAQTWNGYLTARVKREYAARIGGRWDLRASNPVTRWHDDVAQLRNRVVHGAYVPTFGEATLALSRLAELTNFLVDRLLRKSYLRKYPRTAWMIAGERGFKVRKVSSPELAALQEDPAQPNWDETFGRWRDAVSRCRRDAEHPRAPDPAAAFLVAVRHPDGTVIWCLHDRSQHLAALVVVDPSKFPEEQRTGMASMFERIGHENPDTAVSAAFYRDTGLPVEVAGPWVEEYRLVPLAGVMVDGTDLDHPAE